PNNLSEYDWTLDPDWTTFTTMIRQAAQQAHQRDKKVLMGGTSPTDLKLIEFLFEREVAQHFDAVGVHAFPGVWEHNWKNWDHLISGVRETLQAQGSEAEVWISETGYSTWDYNLHDQLKTFTEALEADVERLYWYSLHDLHEQKAALVGFHTDEREYHFGMITASDQHKPLFSFWSKYGIDSVEAALEESDRKIESQPGTKRALITGGAGFIGTNLAKNLLDDGYEVTLFDNLSRDQVINNLRWLQDRYPGHLNVKFGDMRNPYELREALKDADEVYHLAGQVAVTTSLEYPLEDFEINVRGTLNLLEILRTMGRPPGLIFTSTNKVYGSLQGLETLEQETRYEPADARMREYGVDEDAPLDMHSPYGVSKGAADQYVLDYARMFGIPTAVFRMSCIYGPHQWGTEDQGWIAHFLLSTLKGETITLYGNGKQVRDALFVEDLVEAMRRTQAKMEDLQGNAFNLGGGPERAVSLVEMLEVIEEITGRKPKIEFADWRPGDQRYYVSNTSKIQRGTGWSPKTNLRQGVKRLLEDLQENRDFRTLALKERTT
ncbi:MAG: GDP-mannose 4,6-dehydratase, partial [Fimbriimonadaceae bacterium]